MRSWGRRKGKQDRCNDEIIRGEEPGGLGWKNEAPSGWNVEAGASKHRDEHIIILPPPVALSAVFSDSTLNLPAELALRAVLGATNGADFVGCHLDGSEQPEGIAVRLRVKRVRNYTRGFDRCNDYKVATFVDADIRGFSECGDRLVVTLQANNCFDVREQTLVPYRDVNA